MNLAQWQTAYPYITNKSTGIKLGDYEDAHRKFLEAWRKANPWTGPNPGMNFSPSSWEQGWTPTQADYDLNRQYSDYENQMQEAFAKMLTPEQQQEYAALKKASYSKHKRLGQMAFLGAVGAMAAPGLIGAMGAEGAGGAAAGAAGGFDAAAAADMAGGLLPEFGTSAAYSAIPGLEGMATGTLGSSAWNSIPEFLKSLGTSAAKNVGGNWLSQLIASGTNAYMGNKQAGQYQDVINQINQLYAPDSPYAKQMQQAMERKDAAAGRNSQYGTRGVELAAALTNSKANALTSAGYGNLLQQRGINQNIPWNGFLAALGSGPGQDLITKAGGGIASWLSGLYGNSGEKVIPTQPNSGNNWWNMVFADGGP